MFCFFVYVVKYNKNYGLATPEANMLDFHDDHYCITKIMIYNKCYYNLHGLDAASRMLGK